MRKELKKKLKKAYLEQVKTRGKVSPYVLMGALQAWAKLGEVTAEETAKLACWLMFWAVREEAEFVKKLYRPSLS